MFMSPYYFWLLSILILTNCGTSAFVHLEEDDPGQDAVLALEEDKPDEAISILEKAIAKDPTNYTLISLLGTAIAQKYGIDVISLALAMADNEKASAESETASSSGNEITALFSALPEVTDDNRNINGLQRAIDTMNQIPEGLRTKADNFKLTLFHTSLLGLRTRKFDVDKDNQISPGELFSMSDDDAIAIFSSLLSAQEAISAGTAATTGEDSAASLNQVSKIREAIDAEEGESTADKLKSYLQSS